MIVVSKLTKTCPASPAQWSGVTDKGEEVYVRYRWGYLRVEVNEETVFAKQIGQNQNDEEVIAEYRANGMSEDMVEKMAESFKNMRKFMDIICFDGYMDLEQLREVTKGVIQWPAEETDNE